MPIGIIILGCVAFVCVTAVVLRYLDKRDINADLKSPPIETEDPKDRRRNWNASSKKTR